MGDSDQNHINVMPDSSGLTTSSNYALTNYLHTLAQQDGGEDSKGKRKKPWIKIQFNTWRVKKV